MCLCLSMSSEKKEKQEIDRLRPTLMLSHILYLIISFSSCSFFSLIHITAYLYSNECPVNKFIWNHLHLYIYIFFLFDSYQRMNISFRLLHLVFIWITILHILFQNVSCYIIHIFYLFVD